MKWHPRGYGGERRPADAIKREGWREQGVLVVQPRGRAAQLARAGAGPAAG